MSWWSDVNWSWKRILNFFSIKILVITMLSKLLLISFTTSLNNFFRQISLVNKAFKLRKAVLASAKRGAQNLLETQLLRRYELLRVSSHVGDFPLSFHLMKTLFVLISIVAKQRYYTNILCQKNPKIDRKYEKN